MSEAACMTLAEIRWKCQAHRIPDATDQHPQYLFTRDTVEAIGVAHYREIETPFLQLPGVDFSTELWGRARFLSSALAFVSIVSAPDGLYFATIKDFDRDVAFVPARVTMDSPAKWFVPRKQFRELRPEGAQIGG